MCEKVLICALLFLKVVYNDFGANAIFSGRQIMAIRNIYIYKKDRDDFTSLLNVSLSGPKINDLKSLNGKTVRVIADNMPPYITSSNNSQNLGGYLGDIWGIIEDAFKFKRHVVSIFYDTGLNIIETGDADVMLAAAVVNDKLVNVYYSQPYFYNWYHLYIKHPEARPSSSSYLKTFNAKLWFVTLGLFVILTMSLWLTIKFLNRICHLEPHVSVPSCFLGTVSGFINQGYDMKLISYSGRIQVMFALILGVVLYSAMNAVLVAQLAVFDVPFPFKSLDDIADVKTHSLCLRTNSFVHNNFTNAQKEVLPRWKNILNGKGCLDINNQDNLATILCQKNTIILENRVVMTTVIKNYNITCDIISFREKYFKKDNSFIMVKAFQASRLIDNFVKKMRSAGVLQRLEYKWIRKDKLMEANNGKSPQVTIKHIDGIIFMYIIMIALSFTILSCEILYYRYRNSSDLHIHFVK